MTKNWKKREDEIVQYFRDWLADQTAFKGSKEIARHLQISNSHLGNVLSGRRKGSDNLLERIAIMIQFDGQEGRSFSSVSDKERPYLDFTEELRKWFFNQSKWKTQKELAADLGMPYSSCKKFFQGRAFPRGKIRERLYEITEIEMLGDDQTQLNIVKEGPLGGRPTSPLAGHLEVIGKATKTIQQELDSLRTRVSESGKHSRFLDEKKSSHDRVAAAFYVLAEELVSLKDSGRFNRKELIRRMSPKDVGYVTSFLKALYDEERFTDFIFFTRYKFERRVGEK